MANTRPPARGPQPPQRRDSSAPGRLSADGRYPDPHRSSPLKAILLYGGVALLCLAVGAGTFFIMSPPTELIRREIIAGVKRETGRDLTIGGGASFTIFPAVGLRLN